jgi:hypothetical protein
VFLPLSRVIIKVILRPTVSWSPCLGVRHPFLQSESQSYIMTNGQSASLSWCQAPIWDLQQIFLLSLIIFGQLWICLCWPPSLTKVGYVIFNFCWASPVQSFSCLGPTGLEHILLSLFFRLPQLGGPGFCIYFTLEQVSRVILLGIGFF